jgi:hypothetical protein
VKLSQVLLTRRNDCSNATKACQNDKYTLDDLSSRSSVDSILS